LIANKGVTLHQVHRIRFHFFVDSLVKQVSLLSIVSNIGNFGKQCTVLLHILIANKTAAIIENIISFDVSAYA